MPERFDLEGPVPNETNTDFRSLYTNFTSFLLEALLVLYLMLPTIYSNYCIADSSHSVEGHANVLAINLLYLKQL